MFWVLAAFLTLAATLAVLVPLTRARGEAVAGADYDVEVYRNQLKELEGDQTRGLIDEVSAEEARGEIGRRLLKAAKTAETGAAAPSRASGRWLVFAAVISVPIVSWGFYSQLGSPELPAEPLAARLTKDPAKSTVQELLARAERHLASNPDDGQGWQVLAPIYLRVGQFGKAATAYRNAIRLLGSTAERETGLGEALTAAGGGKISPDAHAAFERAAKIDPKAIGPRFFLASELAQGGKFDEAESQFKALRPLAGDDKRWQQEIGVALAQIAKQRGGPATAGAPGPSASDVAAASQMTTGQRTAMIEGMVAKLADRLKSEPGDVEGWKRLVRSYVVLGRKDAARDAVKRGSAAIASAAGDDAKASFLEFAKGLGVTAADQTQ